jgi:hypothetical protein
MNSKQKKVLVISFAVSVFIGAVVLSIILLQKKLKGDLSKNKLKQIIKDDVTYWKGVTETDRKGAEKLKEWWSWIGLNYSVDQLMSSTFQSEHYWSAVYISSVLKRWGAGDRFNYSQRHAEFFHKGKEDRENNVKDALYWTYAPDEVIIEVGDIIGYPRQSGLTYENLYPRAKSHSDIVYDVVKDQDGSGYKAYMSGGNLSNTQKIGYIQLDNDRKLVDPKYYAVMKFRK